MNDIQVRCFLAVAESMNFSRASELLFISQPAVSRHIANLEKELGTVLFNRHEKPIRFTSAGEAYYKLFSNFGKEFSEVKARFAVPKQAESATITFAINSIWYFNDALAGCVSCFETQHPKIHVSLRQYLSTNIVSSIDDEDADILIHMTSVLDNAPGLEVRKLGVIRNVFCYSIRHPLARHGPISLADFDSARFVYIDDGPVSPAELRSGIRSKIRSLLPDALPEEDLYYPAPNSDIANSLVDDGICVIMQDEWARLRNRSTIRSFLVDGSEESVSLAWRKDRENETIRLFADEAVEYFRTHSLRLE